MEALNEFVISLATSPWVYVILFAVVALDAIFPPMPSESVLVALAAVAVSAGVPTLLLLVVVAGVGAMAGDNLAYLIGRSLGLERFRWMKRPRIQKLVIRSRRELDRRAGTLVLGARFVPVGRVVVNMVAGATRFPQARFARLTAVSGMLWSLYSVFIGAIAGAWIHGNPVLGATIAVVIALAIGVILDAISRRAGRSRRRRAEVAMAATAAAASTPKAAESTSVLSRS
jgi:membrane-associated protein